ncbi:unnamed protein product [Durusdinium trenchii]|uniref:alpha-amylase n=1 Tax=Durusdinium trenchii TaxID=1381693 RepID=A0ABP0QJD7_9DINO
MNIPVSSKAMGPLSLLSVSLLFALAVAHVAVETCDGESCEGEASSVLMLHGTRGYKPRDIRGKSLYFVVTDYFADPPPGQPYSNCSAPGWCNGTLQGITRHLDYIQGMGFEGIWITPAVLQFYGPDPDNRSGYGNYGYWAKDLYKIDPNFGTAEELKQLADELHRRDMVFVYDIVLNHMGPVHKEKELKGPHGFHPFNKPEYYHQLNRGNLTFDEYVKGYAYGGKGYPPPVQGLGPGAMCKKGLFSCDCYRCPVKVGFGDPCPVTPIYMGDEAAGPKDIPFCGVGDTICEGYNELQTIQGWFYDLGDLNQTHHFVSSELIKWGKYMKDTYHIDGFRLDTAPYVYKSFLSEFQDAVEIPILGEVTASNWSFFKSYSPGESSAEKPVLKGLLNFYLQNAATTGFCGMPFFPGANLNLTRLGESMKVEYELNPGQVNDLNLLGNFVDNHDMKRLAYFCSSTMPRMRNALAWTMLTQGIPIIYYGTEHFFKETHPPMWNAGFSTTTPGYTFLQGLNNVRRILGLHTSNMKVEASSENHLIFSRKISSRFVSIYKRVFIFLNNNDENRPVEYDVEGVLPNSGDLVWADVLHGFLVPQIAGGKLFASNSEPMALVLLERISLGELQEGAKLLGPRKERTARPSVVKE